MGNKLYVDNLDFSTSSGELKQLFAVYGAVTDTLVLTDRATGRSRGFGFVQMETNESAQTAVAAMDGAEHGGRTLKVNVAERLENADQSEGSL
jgi:cold-inducible RNA-binding protein